MSHAQGPEAVDGRGDLETAGSGQVSRVLLGAMEGIQLVEAVVVEEGFQLGDDLAQGCSPLREAPGGEVDRVSDGAGLARVDELLDAVASSEEARQLEEQTA